MESRRFFVYLQDTHSEVTGSGHHNKAVFPNKEDTTFLVDCGSFQGEEHSIEYNASFPFNPENVEFVLITHNHLDHIGRLPMLSYQGFNGKCYATEATKVLLPYALQDNYRINSKGEMFYTREDVERILNKTIGIQYNIPTKVSKNITITMLGNGHLPGAASILVQIQNPMSNDSINLLYSGDYHPTNMFFKVPEIPEWVKQLPLTVILESTYGGETTQDINYCFKENLLRAIREEKVVFCPAFSLGRTQEVLYTIRKIQDEVPSLRGVEVRQDGVLSFKYNSEYFNNTIGIDVTKREFLPYRLGYVESQTERYNLVNSKGPKIIISSSGMGSHGPAQFYLPNLLERKDAMIHFTGYLVKDTNGRRIIEADDDSVINNIFGREYVVKRAKVCFTSEFSKHAKQDELISYLKQFNNIRAVLLNHGSQEKKETLQEAIKMNGIAKHVEILSRDVVFRIGPWGIEKSFPSKA